MCAGVRAQESGNASAFARCGHRSVFVCAPSQRRRLARGLFDGGLRHVGQFRTGVFQLPQLIGDAAVGAIHCAAGGIQFLLPRREAMAGNPEPMFQHVTQALLHLVLGIQRSMCPRGDIRGHPIHHAAHLAHAITGEMQQLFQCVGPVEQVAQAAFPTQAAMAQVHREQREYADGENGDLE